MALYEEHLSRNHTSDTNVFKRSALALSMVFLLIELQVRQYKRFVSNLPLTNLTSFLTQRAMELEGVVFCFANSLQFKSKVYGDLWNYIETGTDANPR